MSQMFYIYYHIDPVTNMPVYIGKGTGQRAYRLKNRGKIHQKWINDLKERGLTPIIFVGNTFFNEEEAYNIEKIEISVFQKLGIRLLNKTKGGRTLRHEINHKPICCITTKYWYESSKQAAADLNIPAKRICDVLKGRKRSYKGLQFRYRDEKLNDIPNIIRQKKAQRRKLSASKPVICNETNDIFSSATEAAKRIGVNSTAIFAQMRGKSKKVKGLTFRRIK
jgi:hypothetical protein